MELYVLRFTQSETWNQSPDGVSSLKCFLIVCSTTFFLFFSQKRWKLNLFYTKYLFSEINWIWRSGSWRWGQAEWDVNWCCFFSYRLLCCSASPPASALMLTSCLVKIITGSGAPVLTEWLIELVRRASALQYSTMFQTGVLCSSSSKLSGLTSREQHEESDPSALSTTTTASCTEHKACQSGPVFFHFICN